VILIDSSVWVEYFRGKNPLLNEKLNGLLDDDEVGLAAPVWIELLSGASRSDLKNLRRVLSALPRFYPKRTTWNLMEKWIEKGTKTGYRFGMADLLIAAIAAENDVSLWSLDRDFVSMETLRLVRLF